MDCSTRELHGDLKQEVCVSHTGYLAHGNSKGEAGERIRRVKNMEENNPSTKVIVLKSTSLEHFANYGFVHKRGPNLLSIYICKSHRITFIVI